MTSHPETQAPSSILWGWAWKGKEQAATDESNLGRGLGAGNPGSEKGGGRGLGSLGPRENCWQK